MNFFQFLVDVLFGHRHPKPKPRQAEPDNQSRSKCDCKHLSYMQDLIHKIRHTTHDIMHDLEKFEQGNKAAGKRVRKNSLEIEKLYKEFRKRSVYETPKKE